MNVVSAIDSALVLNLCLAFGAVGSVLSPFLLMAVRRMLARRDQQLIDSFKAITTADVQRCIKEHMLSKIADLDPASYFTHELCFPDGNRLLVPLIPGVPLPVLENIVLQVISQSATETVVSMECRGHGHIGQHSHGDTLEEIHIMSGRMTDLKTGLVHRKGDVWTIEPGVSHSATFSDCVAIIILRPPLPTAKDRPANLEAMSEIFSQ